MLQMTPLDKIHDTLIERGFRADHGPTIRYVGEMELNGFIFPLEITDIDARFIDPPKIKLTRIPKGVTTPLPHIGDGGVLCYLDQEGVVLDRYRPEWTMHLIIDQVKNLLDSYTDPEHSPAEFADEFIAYWHGAWWCYLLTKERPALAREFKRQTIAGDERNEIVIAQSNEQLDDWEKKRHSISEGSRTVPAVIIEAKKRPLIPVSIEWPPTTLKLFHDWLVEIDPGAAHSLVLQLSHVANPNTAIPIVILTPDSIFGILVTYAPTFRLENRSGGARVRDIILSKKHIKNFKRLYVSNATMEHITSRPLEKGTLKGKKIALIGCGAIGGYSAVMLVQAGAGQGIGKLDLYDGDTLASDNMGRHILGVEYLDEQKSTAMKHYIDQHCSTTQLAIRAFGHWDSDQHYFNFYDLIIDATGNQMLSTTLAHELHRMEKRPPIIHGWIDAGGLAVRALTDDKNHACYRCLSMESEKGLKERFPMWDDGDLDKIPKVRRRCGSSYQPYPSSVPAAAAGLIQSMALDISNGNPAPRFRHLSLSNVIRRTKFADPAHLKNCPCCQKT